MSDEQRRRLEREARYDERLAALLECLRSGHVPLAVEGLSPNVVTLQPHPRAANNEALVFRGCSRCGLAYVERVRGRQEGAVRVTGTLLPEFRMPRPEPRPGYCVCGHMDRDHSDLGWRWKCEYSVPFEPSTICHCQRFVQET